MQRSALSAGIVTALLFTLHATMSYIIHTATCLASYSSHSVFNIIGFYGEDTVNINTVRFWV